MSPETLSDEVTETDTPIDIWSLGVIMYVLLFNAYPFEGSTRIQVKMSIKKGLKFPLKS